MTPSVFLHKQQNLINSISMKNLLMVFSLLFSTLNYAQVTQRNILSKKYTLESVKQSLIAQSEYKPFPKTPEAWKAAVPDSVLATIIKDAEALLDYKFEPISATISMDFTRSGDRTRHGYCR